MKKFNSTFLLFILWCFLNITNGLWLNQSNSRYYLIPGTDGLFKYHNTPLEWSSAMETCEMESAILFHPVDEKELITVASSYNNRGMFSDVIWLGVRKSNNRFQTVTGVLLSNTFNIWNDEQIDHDYEDCLEALYTSNSAWKLYSRQCSKKSVFICKKQSVRIINNEVVPRHPISKPGYHIIPGANGLYKYHNIPREWETALAICNEEGATLFFPANENELLTVIRFWQNTENGNVPERFLLDLKKAKYGFRTMSGMPVYKMFNKWMRGEPNNMRNNENCVEIVNRDNVWALNDFTCWVTRKYICKATITEDDQPSMPNLDYRFSELLGKSYKLHLTPKNWNEARAVCQAEGSELAVVNSPEEAAHLVSLMNTVSYSIPENYTHGIILLGFHRRNVENWKTVQGELLTNIKYSQPWGQRQPDSGNGEECGAMFYTGHLTDISCDRRALFICEHVVDNIDFVSEPDIS